MYNKPMRYFFNFILLLSLTASLSAFAAKKQIHYLPDGTEIQIIGNKAYYYCRGKVVLLPDEAYMLCDGSLLTIEDGVITELVLMEDQGK